MRIIGMVAMSVWFTACTSTPMFPPEMMKDVEANTFDAKAWEQQAYQLPGEKFVPHKVELAGQIVKVIQKSKWIIILAEERPIGERPNSGQTNSEPEDAPWFAITFRGTVEPKMLQAGNRLIAVGTTRQARPEMLGGAPRMLPHLKAQCLHIWNTEGVKNMYAYFDDFVEAYPPEERTFCRKDKMTGEMANGVQGDRKELSEGP